MHRVQACKDPARVEPNCQIELTLAGPAFRIARILAFCRVRA